MQKHLSCIHTHMFSLLLAQKQKHTEACFLYFGSFTFVLLEPHIKLSHAHNTTLEVLLSVFDATWVEPSSKYLCI